MPWRTSLFGGMLIALILMTSLSATYGLSFPSTCSDMFANAIQSNHTEPIFTFERLLPSDVDNDPFTPDEPSVKVSIRLPTALISMLANQTYNHTSNVHPEPMIDYVTLPLPYCTKKITTECVSYIYHGTQHTVDMDGCPLSDRDPGGYSRTSGRIALLPRADCDAWDPMSITFHGVDLTDVDPDVVDLYGIRASPIITGQWALNITESITWFQDAYPAETCGFSDGQDFPEADQVLCRPSGNHLLQCAAGGRDPADPTDTAIELTISPACQARDYSYGTTPGAWFNQPNTNNYIYAAAIRAPLWDVEGNFYSQFDARFRTNSSYPPSGSSVSYDRLYIRDRSVIFLDSLETQTYHEVVYRMGTQYEFTASSSDLRPIGLYTGVVPPCICNYNVDCGSGSGILPSNIKQLIPFVRQPGGYGIVRVQWYDPDRPQGDEWVDSSSIEAVITYAGATLTFRMQESWRENTRPVARQECWDVISRPPFSYGNSPVIADPLNFQTTFVAPKDLGEYTLAAFAIPFGTIGLPGGSDIITVRVKPKPPVIVFTTFPTDLVQKGVVANTVPVTLSVVGSYDPDFSPADGNLTFVWSQDNGPYINITALDYTNHTITFIPPSPDYYQFRVLVEDGPNNGILTQNSTASIAFDARFVDTPPPLPPPPGPTPGAGPRVCEIELGLNGTCTFSSNVCASTGGAFLDPGNLTLCPPQTYCCIIGYIPPPPSAPSPTPSPTPSTSPSPSGSAPPMAPDPPAPPAPANMPSNTTDNPLDLRYNIPGTEIILAIIILGAFVLFLTVITVSCCCDPRCREDIEYDRFTYQPVRNADLTVRDILSKRTTAVSPYE